MRFQNHWSREYINRGSKRQKEKERGKLQNVLPLVPESGDDEELLLFVLAKELCEYELYGLERGT